MTIQISTADPRSVKALDVLRTADRWQRGHTKTGRSFYAVPSQKVAGLLHMVDTRACTCRDFTRRRQACKHVLAVRLHVARLRATPAPRPHRTDARSTVRTEVAAASRLYEELFPSE